MAQTAAIHPDFGIVPPVGDWEDAIAMTLKLITLAASAVLGVYSAAYAADVMEVAQPTIFTPYVALGGHCEGELTDQRLAGVPVPAPARKTPCADLEKKISIGRGSSDLQPTLIIFDGKRGRITGKHPY
jgi:hypothetical protein